jgi:hypothetical protein
MVLPEIGKLSLESFQPAARKFGGTVIQISDEDSDENVFFPPDQDRDVFD